MFSFLKKLKPLSSHSRPDRESIKSSSIKSLTLHLQGLHCTSCAINIDLALEDLPSVESTTSYTKQQTKVSYDPTQTSLKQIKSVITKLGYSVQ